MKVHLIRKETIGDYLVRNVQSRKGFEFFLSAVKFADWEKLDDILETFPTMDVLGKDYDGNMPSRLVFDIGGNKYRMICKFHFGEKEVHLFICWIGTHAEYSKLCKAGKKDINQYNANIY